MSKTNTNSLVLVLGNQLFNPTLLKKNLKSETKPHIFMREDQELCTYFKFHKHKIIFFLAAMRTYAEELRNMDFSVHYEEMDANLTTYEKALTSYIVKYKINKI